VPPTTILFGRYQILMNLCTNAFHAMEHTGGRLEILLKETVLGASDPVKDPGIDAGKYVQLSICDTGTGIDPEIKDKIFDPYFTTKEAGKGTGMGLPWPMASLKAMAE
jgi:signal transduction histidine kinase